MTGTSQRGSGREAPRAGRSRGFRRAFVLAAFASGLVAACGWDPAKPFDREAPQVSAALSYYDAGEAGSAATLLQDYLTTGACQGGSIGTPPRVRERPSGSFDLGLALFKIAEQYGHPFGQEESDGGLDSNVKGMRSGQVECALRVVRAIADDPTQPVSLRARARYLEGNLLFLTADYKEAVTAYDHALELAPGMGDAGPIGAGADGGVVTYAPDPLGRDAAHNRAIALRRIEDKKDAGQDASPPSDGGGDGGSDDKNDPRDGGNSADGGGDDKSKDAGGKDDDKQDAGKDSGNDDPSQKKEPPKDEPEAGAPPPSRQSQDDRILDQLENAPTVQQEAAKKHAKTRKVRGMADK